MNHRQRLTIKSLNSQLGDGGQQYIFRNASGTTLHYVDTSLGSQDIAPGAIAPAQATATIVWTKGSGANLTSAQVIGVSVSGTGEPEPSCQYQTQGIVQ